MSTLIRCDQCITTARESDQGWHTVIVNGPIPNWPMVYHLCSPRCVRRWAEGLPNTPHPSYPTERTEEL